MVDGNNSPGSGRYGAPTDWAQRCYLTGPGRHLMLGDRVGLNLINPDFSNKPVPGTVVGFAGPGSAIALIRWDDAVEVDEIDGVPVAVLFLVAA
ncbi:hypothetical protein JCM9533A_42470 [Catenuloplanes niger JCM 9533]